jgi:biotin transporter BioY
MVSMHINSLAFGIVCSFFAYAIEYDEFVTNIFTTVLIASVIAGNLIILYLGTVSLSQTTPAAKPTR